MPISNEGHPYRTPCEKCREKDDLLLKEDKKIKDWTRAYNELAQEYRTKVKDDPDRVVGKWMGTILIIGGLAGLFAWILISFLHFTGGKTAGLTVALSVCVLGTVILVANRVPKLKENK